LDVIWNSLWHILLNVLVAINSVVNVPGVSIIIFTLLIRLLTVPLTMKSLKSNRNMQAIQPLIKEVQRKYKDDKQKQQEETMKLYSQYGINPAAGCFPMLVQLPIFFGLFAALQYTLHPNATELQTILWNPAWEPFAYFGKSSFLWLPSIAAADPYYIFPVLSGLFQFIQNRMAMPRRDPNTPQDAQQRMMNGMMQFMPIYIIFISLGFPAGNTIYWSFSSIFGAVQQYFITGFGSLPYLPGLGWLPKKEIARPALVELPEGAPRKQGLFTKMMDRAMQAQEAQKGSLQERADAESSREVTTKRQTTATSRAARPERQKETAAATTRVRSKASEQQIRVVPSGATGTAAGGSNGRKKKR
jgi:YidC/Oxa1 family membrane protein insertase